MTEMTRPRTATYLGDRVTHYEMSDLTEPIEFDGWLVAHVTTETTAQQRWTTMDLYAIHDPQTDTRYVLDIAGQSVVYHVHDSECNSGVPTPRLELPIETEPCHRCGPPDKDDPDPDLDELVDLELVAHTITTCNDAIAVVEALKWRRDGRDGSEITTMTRPAVRLLAAAAAKDPAFEAANLTPTKRL